MLSQEKLKDFYLSLDINIKVYNLNIYIFTMTINKEILYKLLDCYPAFWLWALSPFKLPFKICFEFPWGLELVFDFF